MTGGREMAIALFRVGVPSKKPSKCKPVAVSVAFSLAFRVGVGE